MSEPGYVRTYTGDIAPVTVRLTPHRHKFKVEQVVAIRENGQLYARINGLDKHGKRPAYYLALEGHGYHRESELRALSTKERGTAIIRNIKLTPLRLAKALRAADSLYNTSIRLYWLGKAKRVLAELKRLERK